MCTGLILAALMGNADASGLVRDFHGARNSIPKYDLRCRATVTGRLPPGTYANVELRCVRIGSKRLVVVKIPKTTNGEPLHTVKCIGCLSDPSLKLVEADMISNIVTTYLPGTATFDSFHYNIIDSPALFRTVESTTLPAFRPDLNKKYQAPIVSHTDHLTIVTYLSLTNDHRIVYSFDRKEPSKLLAIDTSSQKHQSATSMTADYAHPPAPHWFPSRITTRRKVGEKESIEVVEFEPPDWNPNESIFREDVLGLKNGMVIADATTRKNGKTVHEVRQYEDGKFVPIVKPKERAAPRPVTNRYQYSSWWYVLIGAFVVVALVLFAIGMRKRRTS
jgi:hypothetical protein